MSGRFVGACLGSVKQSEVSGSTVIYEKYLCASADTNFTSTLQRLHSQLSECMINANLEDVAST